MRVFSFARYVGQTLQCRMCTSSTSESIACLFEDQQHFQSNEGETTKHAVQNKNKKAISLSCVFVYKGRCLFCVAGDSGAIRLTVCKKYQHHTDMLNGLVRTIKPCGHYYNQERRGQRCPWKPRKSCIVCQIRTCSPRKRIMQSAIRVVRAESGVLCALFRALEPVNSSELKWSFSLCCAGTQVTGRWTSL